DGLQKQGATDLKGTKAPITPPIPNEVSFLLFGTKDGATIAFGGAVVFGNDVYQIQAASSSADEAKKLAEVAKSLKEPANTSAAADKSGQDGKSAAKPK